MHVKQKRRGRRGAYQSRLLLITEHGSGHEAGRRDRRLPIAEDAERRGEFARRGKSYGARALIFTMLYRRNVIPSVNTDGIVIPSEIADGIMLPSAFSDGITIPSVFTDGITFRR